MPDDLTPPTPEQLKAARLHRRAEQDREGIIAMRDYQKDIQHTRDTTTRLRALRLAKEAADASAPPPANDPKPAKKKRAAKARVQDEATP